MAGLEQLIFHTVDGSGRKSLDEATQLLRESLATGAPTETGALIGRTAALGLEWGASDGS